MKIRKLTNEEIKGACAFAVSIYNIAIRGCFRTQESHRYFDENLDADRVPDDERSGVVVRSVRHDKRGAYHHAVCASAVFKTWNWQKASGESQDICAHAA